MTKQNRTLLIACLVIAGLALCIVLPKIFKARVLEAYRMPSGSMQPTLLIGDQFIANKSARNLKTIRRGDVILFAFPPDTKKLFVKRVVGLPGDRIGFKNKALYINGAAYKEDYVVHSDPRLMPADRSPRDTMGPITVPEDAVFVLGDNRDASNDSRFWGYVPSAHIRGKAITIYWSWDRHNARVRWDRIGKKIH